MTIFPASSLQRYTPTALHFGRVTPNSLLNAKHAPIKKIVTNPHSDLRIRMAYYRDYATETGDRLTHNKPELNWTLRRLTHLPANIKATVAKGVGQFRFRETQLPLLQTLLQDQTPAVYDAALKSVRTLSRPKSQLPHSTVHAQWAKLRAPVSGDNLVQMVNYFKTQAPADKDLLTLIETAIKNPLATEYSEASSKRRAFLASRVMGVRTTQFTHIPAMLNEQLKTKTELSNMLERQVNLMANLAYADPTQLKEKPIKPLHRLFAQKTPPSVLDRDPAMVNPIAYETQVTLLAQRVKNAPLEREAQSQLTQKLEAALLASKQQLRLGA